MLYQYFEIFENFLEVQDKFSAGIYLIIAKIIAGITFFPGTPLTLLAGATLGTFWGIVVSLTGNFVGATFAFLIARYLLNELVQDKLLKKYPKIHNFEKQLFSNGFSTVLFLRLVPLFPFNVLNFILGVTEVRLKDYMFGTLLGIVPGTIVFVLFGESLRMFNVYTLLLGVVGIVGLSYVGKVWKIK